MEDINSARLVAYVVLAALSTVLISALIAITAAAFLWVGTQTGKGCPGKDPEWLGWCSQAPDAV